MSLLLTHSVHRVAGVAEIHPGAIHSIAWESRWIVEGRLSKTRAAAIVSDWINKQEDLPRECSVWRRRYVPEIGGRFFEINVRTPSRENLMLVELTVRDDEVVIINRDYRTRYVAVLIELRQSDLRNLRARIDALPAFAAEKLSDQLTAALADGSRYAYWQMVIRLRKAESRRSDLEYMCQKIGKFPEPVASNFRNKLRVLLASGDKRGLATLAREVRQTRV